jgi:hypothetical protein
MTEEETLEPSRRPSLFLRRRSLRFTDGLSPRSAESVQIKKRISSPMCRRVEGQSERIAEILRSYYDDQSLSFVDGDCHSGSAQLATNNSEYVFRLLDSKLSTPPHGANIRSKGLELNELEKEALQIFGQFQPPPLKGTAMASARKGKRIHRRDCNHHPGRVLSLRVYVDSNACHQDHVVQASDLLELWEVLSRVLIVKSASGVLSQGVARIFEVYFLAGTDVWVRLEHLNQLAEGGITALHVITLVSREPVEVGLHPGNAIHGHSQCKLRLSHDSFTFATLTM